METDEQREVVKRFRERWPEHTASLRPSMNGISRAGGIKAAKMWNFMKALGADEEDLDLAILVPKGGYCGLIIEHKGEGQPHKLTEGQQAQIDYFNGIGYMAISTRGTEALWAAIVAYMGEV